MIRSLTLILLSILILPLRAQENYAYNPLQIDTLIVAQEKRGQFVFPERHRVMDQSIQLRLNERLLSAPVEYRYDGKANRIEFFIPIARGDSLHIRYQIQPILLKKTYRYFKVDTLKSDSLKADSILVTGPYFQNPFTGFTGNLKRSGSIVRGVNIGSNKDLTINSGLNLQLSGYLTDDVEIVAALTDESTPIQPEGNTLALREVDKVYIQFASPWLSGSLGDFNLQYTGSQFATLTKKLQGISLSGDYKDYKLGATIASTRGFFNFMSFLGQEGNQGPYELVGKEGEQDIVVLAGTERVWVDGQKMVRGETNDYVIEYGNGQITFTTRRLISSESRIEIDFEYYPITQKYTRNVYSGLADWSLYKNKFTISGKYYREYDDPDKVLEQEGVLSEEEKEKIRQAGDDPYAAYVDGAVEVDDSLGSYIRVDTLIAGQPDSLYRYVGERKGNYRVIFSSVGRNRGDYTRDRIGVYRWVGKGRGGYLPIKLLPLPTRQQLADFQIKYTPLKDFYIDAEYAISELDRNIISQVNDKDNYGNALRVSGVLNPSPISLAKTELGIFAVNVEGRYIEKKFQAVDRFKKPDFNRYWNILRETETSSEEKSIDANGSYLPWKWLTIQGNMGVLNKGTFESIRYQGKVDVNEDNWVRANLLQEYVESKQIGIANNWIRQSGAIERDFIYFQPGFTFKREKRKNYSSGELSGFEYFDWGARLALINFTYLKGYLRYNERKDDVFDPAKSGQKIPQAKTNTTSFGLDLFEWNRFSGHLEIVFRKKNYTPFFENIRVDSSSLKYIDPAYQDTVWQDRETNLAELILNNYQWNRAFNVRWQYRVSTEQVALREKIYINVGERRGNYRYDKDLDEYVPDPDGDFVLFIVPSGNFEPITNLQTSLRLTLDPRRYWRNPKSTMEKFLAFLSSDTYVRVEEMTKEKNLTQLYLLKPSVFQSINTLKGSFILNEDLYIAKQNRDLSFRLRYRYRDDLFNQFLDPKENEDRLQIERDLRANFRIITNVKGQTDIKNKHIYRFTQADIMRNRDIMSWIFGQNFSYRPDIKWEFGLETEFGWENDSAKPKDLRIRFQKLLLRINYALLKMGRISAEYELQNVDVLKNLTGASIPYEMAHGRKEGVSKRWQLKGEYTVTENVVFSLLYRGRDEPTFNGVIHSGQAEVRAYF